MSEVQVKILNRSDSSNLSSKSDTRESMRTIGSCKPANNCLSLSPHSPNFARLYVRSQLLASISTHVSNLRHSSTKLTTSLGFRMQWMARLPKLLSYNRFAVER